jgi:hypothetical protein
VVVPGLALAHAVTGATLEQHTYVHGMAGVL